MWRCLALAVLAAGDDVRTYLNHLGHRVEPCRSGALSPRGQASVGLGVCVYIDPRGNIVHAHDLRNMAGSGKQMMFDASLRGALATLREVGALPARWTSFAVVYTASGPVRRQRFPVVAIGKRQAMQPGLLMPNPFFGPTEWWRDFSEAALARAWTRPFESRRGVALFRGACGPGARERLKLVRLGSSKVDAGFTSAEGFACRIRALRGAGENWTQGRALMKRTLPWFVTLTKEHGISAGTLTL